jgi:hypothetical protein
MFKCKVCEGTERPSPEEIGRVLAYLGAYRDSVTKDRCRNCLSCWMEEKFGVNLRGEDEGPCGAVRKSGGPFRYGSGGGRRIMRKPEPFR